MIDWYPRCCPQCSLRFDTPHELMRHHTHSGHEPPPFCAACQCMVDSGGDGPDGCRCVDNATLQNPHTHRFVSA
jgi:hypothetical protein